MHLQVNEFYEQKFSENIDNSQRLQKAIDDSKIIKNFVVSNKNKAMYKTESHMLIV